MHSADATRHGLAVGDTVALSSTAGEIHVPLEIDDDIRPGVVSMPHGWGHSDPHSRLTVAKAHAGTNTNILSPGTMVDSISGNAVLNGIPVQVRRRSEEHTSELQSLMRISYAVFCLKKTNPHKYNSNYT